MKPLDPFALAFTPLFCQVAGQTGDEGIIERRTLIAPGTLEGFGNARENRRVVQSPELLGDI